MVLFVYSMRRRWMLWVYALRKKTVMLANRNTTCLFLRRNARVNLPLFFQVRFSKLRNTLWKNYMVNWLYWVMWWTLHYIWTSIYIFFIIGTCIWIKDIIFSTYSLFYLTWGSILQFKLWTKMYLNKRLIDLSKWF
jgi:hypothetical protein